MKIIFYIVLKFFLFFYKYVIKMSEWLLFKILWKKYIFMVYKIIFCLNFNIKKKIIDVSFLFYWDIVVFNSIYYIK